jgi:hypothetical protein
MAIPVCDITCGAPPGPAVPAAALVVAAQLHNDDPDGQVIPSGIATPVLLPDLGFEIGNIQADPTTGQITILESGLYQLTFFGWWAPNGADGFIALSLLAPPGTSFPLAPPSDQMSTTDLVPISQHSTTFGELEAGQVYSLVATQVSGETRTLILPMLSIVKV